MLLAGIDGATDPQIALTNVSVADVGTYAVHASNPFGTAISSNAGLSVARGPMTAFQVPDGIRTTVTSDAGLNYLVQRSWNLVQWESLAKVLDVGSRWAHMDSIEPDSSPRFCRLLPR